MKELLKKKINKKGFTLIELLAVIVILAVLMLLALPAALRIMENARKKAFEQEVRSYLKAAQMKYIEMSVSNQNQELLFQEEGIGDCVNTTCQLDNIDLKSGYHYNIKVRKNSQGNLVYSYTIRSAPNNNNKQYIAVSRNGSPKEKIGTSNYVPFNHIIGYHPSSL